MTVINILLRKSLIPITSTINQTPPTSRINVELLALINLTNSSKRNLNVSALDSNTNREFVKYAKRIDNIIDSTLAILKSKVVKVRRI